jgi:hypothetical protein
MRPLGRPFSQAGMAFEARQSNEEAIEINAVA